MQAIQPMQARGHSGGIVSRPAPRGIVSRPATRFIVSRPKLILSHQRFMIFVLDSTPACRHPEGQITGAAGVFSRPVLLGIFSCLTRSIVSQPACRVAFSRPDPVYCQSVVTTWFSYIRAAACDHPEVL